MKKLNIVTPVLKYWGFEEHPFADSILMGENLKLFIGREEELHSLHNALNNRLNGVYGTQGVGKSSFLRRFQQVVEHASLPVVYIHMTGKDENSLYREILSAILQALERKTIRTKRKVKPAEELERIENSYRLASESEVGADAVVRGIRRETKERQYDIYNEDTARQRIREIISSSLTAFVVIIDDLERLELFMRDDDQYFRFMTGFARTVDESFSSECLSFVVSLDEKFVKRISKELPGQEGAISFSFGDLIRLRSFSPQEFINVIRKRLRDRGWKKKLNDFITEDSLWTLLAATGGHARRSLAVLRSAMEQVEVNRKQPKLDVGVMKAALGKRGEHVDEKDIAIISYLSNNGRTSAWDDKLQKQASLQRPQLSVRLKSLVDTCGLVVSQESSGKTTRDVFALPAMHID